MLLEPISADKCTQIPWKLNPPPEISSPKCIHTHTAGIIELAITVRCITKESTSLDYRGRFSCKQV